MPRDASGNYTPPAGNPVAAGAVITTTWANPTVTDIGTELTASLDRNGQGGMLAGLKAFAGVVTLPGISFTSEVTSGLYYNTTADLRFSVLGADTTRWVDDSATPAGSQEPFEIWNGSAWVKALSTGGAVTSVGGTGTVNGITLTGTVTSTGNLTLGGALTGVDLTSQVTGILPVANGGTGSSSTTFVNLTTNVTGTLPVANGGTGITSFGAGIADFLGTPSSANLATAVTDETGSGALVFATSPTLVTPALGTPSALVATNATGTAAGLTAGVSTLTNALKSATTTVSVSGATAPTADQVLTATSGTAATWQDAGGGGAWTLISVTDASASSTIDITGIDSTYDDYMIVCTNYRASASEIPHMRMKIGGSWRTDSKYKYFQWVVRPQTGGDAFYLYSNGTDDQSTSIKWTEESANSAGQSGQFIHYFFNVNSTTEYKTYQGNHVMYRGALYTGTGGGIYINNTGALTGVRYYQSSGTITVGKFKLYGLQKAT